MKNENKPLINFPEAFPIKVFALDKAELITVLESIILAHVKPDDILAWHKNPSAKGKYIAVTITIMAQNQAQLDDIYRAITSSEYVTMAL